MSRAVKGAPCVVSVADHTGWAHLVCVAAHGRVPAVIERRRVTLIDPGLPTQPYEHDTMAMREDEAEELVARIQKSVSVCTIRALERLVGELAPTSAVVALTIREPPFPSIPKSVAAVHASYQLRCSADGMMYQQAICRAAHKLKLAVHLCKRGEEAALAAEQLAVTADEVAAFVAGPGRPTGPPWTEEHRRAFAAGMAALAPHVRQRTAGPAISISMSARPRRSTEA